MFCGGSLAEGWACYACDLMDEVGFLSPPVRVAQQQTRVRLVARGMSNDRIATALTLSRHTVHRHVANILTNPQLDPIGKIPEFKFCAAKVEPVSG